MPMRFTIPQYRELNRTGLFHDVKSMLIDGELYVMPMPNPPHNIGLSLTEDWLGSIFAGKACHIRNQQAFDIGTRNDPGPDLAVVVGKIRDYETYNPNSALLIVEIADSSLAIDTGRKVGLYGIAGVADYWVLDVEGRQLHLFRDPQADGTYSTRQLLKESDSVTPLSAPASSIVVAELLPHPATE